ncbi:hypothetical protein SLE2022_109020 [Rubroshorea leprosula]
MLPYELPMALSDRKRRKGVPEICFGVTGVIDSSAFVSPDGTCQGIEYIFREFIDTSSKTRVNQLCFSDHYCSFATNHIPATKSKYVYMHFAQNFSLDLLSRVIYGILCTYL